MTFQINELRNALSEKYNVSFTRQTHENSRWYNDTSTRSVYEPRDYKEDEWLYVALHEIGHVENNHNFARDTYKKLQHEAEAWRW